jgi:hypothetical protein
MPRYRATFNTTLSIDVILDAEDDDEAGDRAWETAEEYAQSLTARDIGSMRVLPDATFDGIGADGVEEIMQS